MEVNRYNLHSFGRKFPWRLLLPGIFPFLLMLISTQANAQLSFNELHQKMQQEPKYIIMNISSESCIYCMMQQKKLKKDTELQKRLESEVYYFQWMVEETNAISFNNHYFKNGKEFVDKYGKTKDEIIGYPLWIVFDENDHVVFRNPGLMKNEELNKVLNVLKNEKK